MTTPAIISITPEDDWQKVATNITNGRFIIKDRSGPNGYLYTYVDTGDAAPTGIPIGNIFDDDVEFSNSDASDFYIYSIGAVGSIETQL